MFCSARNLELPAQFMHKISTAAFHAFDWFRRFSAGTSFHVLPLFVFVLKERYCFMTQSDGLLFLFWKSAIVSWRNLMAVCFCFERALLFHDAIWLVKDLELRLTRRVCSSQWFSTLFSLFGWILKIQWKYQWKTLVHLKEVFMILHYRRTRIWRRAGRFTGEFRDIRKVSNGSILLCISL